MQKTVVSGIDCIHLKLHLYVPQGIKRTKVEALSYTFSTVYVCKLNAYHSYTYM